MDINTYIVTFVAEPHDDELEKDPEAGLATVNVTVESHMPVDLVAAGEYDAHELIIRRARRTANLARQWEATHITLSDGNIITARDDL